MTLNKNFKTAYSFLEDTTDISNNYFSLKNNVSWVMFHTVFYFDRHLDKNNIIGYHNQTILSAN